MKSRKTRSSRPLRTSRTKPQNRAQAAPPARQDASASKAPFAIVGVGASAGGLEAFSMMLEAMPADANVAIVFVLHMAASHHSLLAEILSRETTMQVTEVRDELRVEPNHVYVIPPGRAMIIRNGLLSLSPDPKVAQHRSIDRFLTSLAEDQGHRAIGVILSGTATDGTIGLESIKAAGGITFAQDDSAQQAGMPQSATSAGCVDFVLAPAEIAREIARLSRHPLIEAEPPGLESADDIEKILGLLKHESGVDFGQYKSNTLHRRIKRRMVLHKLPSLSDYAGYLKQNAKELEALYQDILISATSFFRDPEAFEALKAKVFPALFQDRSRHDPVRAWVLGCSTGEESYSIAIALKEYATEIGSQVPLVVYATDLNTVSIEKSRAGFYPKEIDQDVSPERLQRFFVEVNGGYRIARSIRDICVFARQNVLTDPPFSRMDLISCRNVLIYMEPALQRKLMPILHFALKPNGSLFLGPSESVSSRADLFEVADAKHKLFRKIPSEPSLEHGIPLAAQPSPHAGRRSHHTPVGAPPEVISDVQRDADRVLLARYVPAGVLVNEQHEVVHFRGNTGLFLTPAPGKASHDLLKMAREWLLLPLRVALQRAKKQDAVVREEGVRVRTNGGFHDVSLTIVPVKRPKTKDRCYWVLFEPQRASKPVPTRQKRDSGNRAISTRDQVEHVTQLTRELAATREYLQSVIEQQEAANEELQSANEEVQSANEELQSINEELETSREEIQSSNEELTTVNEELHNRNEELNRANSDLTNIFGSVQLAIVMVSRELRIRRLTPLAEKLFNLIPSDIGRPISDIKMNVELPDLRELLGAVTDTGTVREQEVLDTQGHWHLLRIRPYRTLEDQIDGAVIALVDIDAWKKDQETLARQARLLEQAHEAIFVRDMNGEILYWNRGAERLYGYVRDEVRGRLSHELLGVSREQADEVRRCLEARKLWIGELAHRTKEGRAIVVDSEQTLIGQGDRALVFVADRDVTERKQLELSLRRRVDELATADRHKNEFLAMLAHELRNPLAPLRSAIQILRNPGISADEGVRTQDLIERQVTKLSRLVDDLLDAARITRRQVQLRREPVDLRIIMQRAVETTRDMIVSRHQRLSVNTPSEAVIVDVDPMRLEQVLGNLLNNASKYTRDRGEISLTLALDQGDGGSPSPTAIVRVKDNGSGIQPEMLPRVFDLFTQADRSLAHKEGGLGIGLSLVRSLVELHGGRVTAHSEGTDRGSEFTVYLPALDPEKARTARPERAAEQSHVGSSELQAARVLVVDDNPDIVESTALLLRLQGREVRTALGGAQALKLLASFQPAVVLLDIGMPDIDGYSLASMIREQPGLEDVVLVAMTGYGSDEARERSAAAGFDHHLVKPIDPDHLRRLLDSSQSQPRRLKKKYGTTDEMSIKPSASQGPQVS